MAVRAAALALFLAAPQDPFRKGDDREFLARLALDLTGAAPAEADLKAFAADADPDKRAKKVSELLESDRFAEFWARRFLEVLAGDPQAVKPTWVFGLAPETPSRRLKDFETWLRDKIKKDRPWTEIAAEILDARGKSEQTPAVAYHLALYRDEGFAPQFADAAARQFLGIRLYCAKCHDHPFDNWMVTHYYGLAAFAVRQRMKPYGTAGAFEHVELTYVDKGEMLIGGTQIDSEIVRKSKGSGVAKPLFPLGGEAGPDDDRMKKLVELMTGRQNTQFSKALVNRVWGWLFGRGVVHPVDDFGHRNRPAVSGVLESLSKEFAEQGYSLKRLVRSLCLSERYQHPGGWKAEMEAASLKASSWETRALQPRPLKDPKPLELGAAPPADWIRVASYTGVFDPPYSGIAARATFYVPDKAKKAKAATFRLGEIPADRTLEEHLRGWGSRMPGVKPKAEEIKAASKTTLHTFSGAFTCERGAGGPMPYEVAFGVVERAGRPWFFELAGPAETVRGWREEYLSLLTSAPK